MTPDVSWTLRAEPVFKRAQKAFAPHMVKAVSGTDHCGTPFWSIEVHGFPFAGSITKELLDRCPAFPDHEFTAAMRGEGTISFGVCNGFRWWDNQLYLRFVDCPKPVPPPEPSYWDMLVGADIG